MVEAVRHADLGGRRDDRNRGRTGPTRPGIANPAAQNCGRMAQGALRVSRRLALIPIVLLIWIVGGFAWRLVKPVDTAAHSQMVEKELPTFNLAAAGPGKPGLNSPELATGKPRLLNLFGSWCVPCVGEAPVLTELKRRGVEIDAIAIRDTPDAVVAFLNRYGDPYQRIGADPHSETQIGLGSSGVPETFLIDGHGIIRRQYIGPLTTANVSEIVQQLAALK